MSEKRTDGLLAALLVWVAILGGWLLFAMIPVLWSHL